MRYVLKHSNGDERIIDEDVIDKSTSLDMFGMNYDGYSTYYNINIKNLLTHFADRNPPRNPLKGQLWYNNISKMLNIYDNGWTEISPPLPDMSVYAMKNDSKMTGVLRINDSIVPKELSVITRAYVDTKKFKFKDEKRSDVSYVQHDNDYTIINMNIDMSDKKKVYVGLPYQMKDINYSISLSVNTVQNNCLDTIISTYDKTINGFGMIVDNNETINVIVMGYMTKNPIELPPEPVKVLVFQIANENMAADDDFEIILNGKSLGNAILSKDELIGTLFIANKDTSITLSSGDFAVPVDNMERIFFDPSILIVGENTLQMKSIKNNGTGNAGIIGIRWYLLHSDKTMSSPTVVDDLSYSGGSGQNFDFKFQYEL